jgi:membrane protein
VQSHPSGALASFALVFSLWFPTRAAITLLRAVRRAYGLEMPKRTLRHAAKAFCGTAVLLAALVGMLGVLSATERAAAVLGVPSLSVPLRLAAVGCGGAFALSLLYRLAQDGKTAWRDLWPGTAVALGAWLVISWGYSIYVEHFADYPALYGSLGTVVAVLVWLELTAATLIMGAEVNGILKHWNHREREEQR